ncbi:phage tail tube protein [Aromatoleum evansii]|uniref:Phage tail tube protein n=1 Tax=Aromatoleum evansii TaxID=59406 RepID=A0ABZ1AR77_AROEV|nr:phage tail tube protein [Aromatoleum evansii]WRL48360.1 phage tail tube protein [Aromatoleum evansii]
MATARKWSNVAVAMQSALAAAKTVTAVTKANPGVASSTAHGYSNGDYVLLTAQGMFQIDGMVARVAGVTADTFQLEGVNTTDFDTFTSGTAEKITFGTSITTATTISASGGDFDFIDTTTIHSNVRTQIPGIANPSNFTMDNIWDVSDAGLVAMKSASDGQDMRAFKFTFGTGGQIMVFAGYVGATLLPGGAAQQLVTTGAVVTMFGRPNYYAS